MQMHPFNRQPMPLVLIDLDHVKLINDTYGHPAGDVTLPSIVGTLSRVFLGDSNVRCRIGGDEFVVLLSNTAARAAERLAARLAARLVQKVTETRASPLSASVGGLNCDGAKN